MELRGDQRALIAGPSQKAPAHRRPAGGVIVLRLPSGEAQFFGLKIFEIL
jgi:hypothetical protein